MGNLVVGWAFMAAFYFVYMRGYKTPDRRRQARFAYRRDVSDRFGLLPPSKEPVGILLWALTICGFVAAIVLAIIGDRFVGSASATMVGAFLLTLWRDDVWLKRQPEYLEAIEAATTTDPDD